MTNIPLLSTLARAFARWSIAGALLCLCITTARAQDCGDAGVPNGALEPVTFTSGGYVIESGAGLTDTGSGTASIDIPTGVTVEEAWVYWAVRNNSVPEGEIDLTVNASGYGTVDGGCVGYDDDIGGASSGPAYAFKYELNTNDLNAGATNTVDVEIDETVVRADGFSVVVVYSMDGETGYSEFYEGVDFVWNPVQETSSLTFSGDILGQCEGEDLSLHLKVGDTKPDRPDRLIVDIDGLTFLQEYNFFGDVTEGWEPQWSDREIVIGGADYNAGSMIMVELASVEDPAGGMDQDPSSLVWVVAGVTCSVTDEEVAGCTRTPGYWRNQGYRSGVLATALADAKTLFTDAFDGNPWGDISVNTARDVLNQNSCRDIGDCLEKHLLASILNVANGATNTISDTIDDAIEFLESGVGDGEALKNTLDSFNNGLEGVPSCDSLEEEGDELMSSGSGGIRHSVGPNPFNPTTSIRFELDESGPIRLAVYDVLGREVRVLLDETISAGEHEIHFDASGLTTGTYFYRFSTPEGAFGGQMILMK